MPKALTAYADNRGTLHATAEAATIADLTAVFGSGDEAERLARLYFEKRAEIEEVLAEHDALVPAEKPLRLVKR